MKTVIVARTIAGSGNLRCIGGIVETEAGFASVRLMNPDTLAGGNTVASDSKGFWPTTAPYQIGDVWDLDFADLSELEPPHVEDQILRGGGDRIAALSSQDLRDFLMYAAHEMQPAFLWTGGPWNVFDRKLNSSKRLDGKGLAVRDKVPSRSTGLWIPDRDLLLDETVWEESANTKRVYRYDRKVNHFGIGTFSYVGEPAPLQKVPAGTIVRVSLARWIALGHYPDACWLMMSGWY